MMTNRHLLSNDEQTIIAQCTPQGSGAIALLRLSGANAIDIATRMCTLSSGKPLNLAPSHTIHHGHVVDATGNNRIDEVLFFLMKAPKTFTGQDTVEISCHNNQFIIQKIIACATYHGARIALPGEFSKRAFLNGKVDLLQAESINEVIGAQSELGLKQALSQLKGSLSQYFYEIEHDLVMLISLVESSFEFLEEEQQDLALAQQITIRLHGLLQKVNYVLEHFNQQEQIRNGVRIAFIGSVNAGKSTLFNALLQKERAIVTDQAGTTRDCVESSLFVDGNFWQLVDTAGIRKTGDIIEQKGIERSFEQAHQADLILLIFDHSKELSTEEYETYQQIAEDYHNKIMFVINKCDKQPAWTHESLHILHNKKLYLVSGATTSGLVHLKTDINLFIQDSFSKLQSPFLLNKRHYNLIANINLKLQSLEDKYSNSLEYELIAYQLREVLETISELTGKNITEGILDKVFSTFCVGK